MKTKGCHDLRKRKRRNDIGRKRKFYAHKKTKPRRKISGKFVPYVSKRRRDAPLKIWFWSVEPMSLSGYMNFNKNIRRKMHRMVYGKQKLRMDVDAETLSTKDNIAELCLEHLWEIKNGYWILMMWSSSKNKYHVSAKAVAKIKINEHPDGMRCRVTPNFNRRSLRKYYFWRDK